MALPEIILYLFRHAYIENASAREMEIPQGKSTNTHKDGYKYHRHRVKQRMTNGQNNTYRHTNSISVKRGYKTKGID